MKTINQVAATLGVSRQTIYNVIKETEGLSIDKLTAKTVGKTRYFNAEAEKTLSKILIDRRYRKATQDNAQRKLEAAEVQIQQLTTQISEKEEQIRKLRTESEEQIQKLRAEADALRENNDILIRTNAANAVTMQQLQKERDQALLTAGTQQKTGRIRKAWRALIGKDDTE